MQVHRAKSLSKFNFPWNLFYFYFIPTDCTYNTKASNVCISDSILFNAAVCLHIPCIHVLEHMYI